MRVKTGRKRPAAPPLVRTGEINDGKRNLVLVNTPELQDRDHFEEIKSRIMSKAPDLIVTIVDNSWPFPGIEKELAKRPSLIVSLTALDRFQPLRGRGYFGHSMDKMQQQLLLMEAGVPFPPSTVLAADTLLHSSVFGEYVVLKPFLGHQSQGAGVQLMRTERVKYIPPAEYPPGHPGRDTPMLVQRFVDTGEHVSSYRVLTFFGAPLLAFRGTLIAERPPLSAADAVIERATVATNGASRRFELIDEPDVLDLARRVHEAAPAIPLKGTDILRDRDGRLWAIEFNPAGKSWAFSNTLGTALRRGIGEGAAVGENPEALGLNRMLAQFSVFQTVADILTEKTRQEAI